IVSDGKAGPSVKQFLISDIISVPGNLFSSEERKYHMRCLYFSSFIMKNLRSLYIGDSSFYTHPVLRKIPLQIIPE
ncbi:MAG: hypothetical protein J5858_05265, partial [Lentisphaeria bacterium]|nr:hypothetical protein [Lentisphaeria bacterium]